MNESQNIKNKSISDLGLFLTPKQPLGPHRHERILRRDNMQDLGLLIYPVEVFDNATAQRSPLIIGRRGSGKTAVTAALLSIELNKNNSNIKTRYPDVYIHIDSWKSLDSLIEKVGWDCSHSIGLAGDWESLVSETVARHWAKRFWVTIFEEFYSKANDPEYDLIDRQTVPLVCQYIEGADFLTKESELNNDMLEKKHQDTLDSVTEYLTKNNRHCYIVIDSLEEYPIRSQKFSKVIAGLLKCVNEFNDDYPCASIICCLPQEIEPIVARRAANKIKDLSDADGVSRLRWRPIELLKIAAERYRAFLKIYQNDDPEFLNSILNLDFSNRANLRKFYELTLPDRLTNKYGQNELTIPYIIRHTQLLPREVLIILNKAIVLSHQKLGSWRHITSESIVNAIDMEQSDLLDQILKPYALIYPQTVEACKIIVPELTAVCSYDDLQVHGRKLNKLTSHETPEPWETLFEMGILGYVDENVNGNSDYYIYGNFHYNSNLPFVLGTGRKYCIHPIFSGSWRLSRENLSCGFVYPASIKENLWEE